MDVSFKSIDMCVSFGKPVEISKLVRDYVEEGHLSNWSNKYRVLEKENNEMGRTK